MRGKGRKGKREALPGQPERNPPFPSSHSTQLKLKIKNSLTASIPHDPDSEPGR